ncbi:hypothetical protein ACLI4Q_16595 [Natrialbaceae archaeon A-CW1-1]
MVEVDSRKTGRAGVAFVRVVVTNTQTTPQHVRLRSTLSGPIWVPRRGDLPAPEWAGDVWEATLEPGRCRGFGFETPLEPVPRLLEMGAETEGVAGNRSDVTEPADLESPVECCSVEPAPPASTRDRPRATKCPRDARGVVAGE